MVGEHDPVNGPCSIHNNDRCFKTKAYGKGVELHELEHPSSTFVHVSCPDRDRKCPRCGRLSPHRDSLIIAVHGVCQKNGSIHARAAVGMYVGQNSSYNVSTIVHGVTTNQTADIMAGIEGLLCVRMLMPGWRVPTGSAPFGLAHVVIKSNSELFVRGMTLRMEKWERNGYRNARGKPIMHQELFKEAMRIVGMLESQGVVVEFWRVPREENQKAYVLANEALSRV